MGKLNIAHHKSYHPYRADNIERVRRDEQDAKDAEEREEGKMQLADSEARIDLLRERAGVSTKRKKRISAAEEIDQAIAQASATSSSSTGHINFFADLEHNARAISDALAKSRDKKLVADADKGVALAPSKKDLAPWYASKNSIEEEDEEMMRAQEARRRKDENSKSRSDPLTSITAQLSASTSTSTSSSFRPHSRLPRPPSASDPGVAARLTRESSERERARELIARKRREMVGSETPGSSILAAGERDREDMYNWRETAEARDRRQRDKGWGHRKW